MPDAPDWFGYQPGTSRHVVGNLGELAARLGALSTYDRRGLVLWQDDFSHGVYSWVHATYGTGGAIKMVADCFHRGGFGLHITAGSDDAHCAKIAKHLAPMYLDKWGFEVTFRVWDTWDNVRLAFHYFTGALAVQGRVRLHKTENEIQYKDSDGNYTKLDTCPSVSSTYTRFSTAKLVIDASAQEYIRFAINNDLYDMKDIALYTETDTTEPYIEAEVRFEGREGHNDRIVIDNVIITTGE